MTQKEAKELSLEVWRYLAEHTEIRDKMFLSKALWEKIRDLRCYCPLCELFRADGPCQGCPLDETGENCRIKGSAYRHWDQSDPDDTETRREAATRIVEIISAWEPEEESDA
jgi:hypothetical protein